MDLPAVTLDLIPSLANIPAACGAILPAFQVGGHTIFDVIVAVIVVKPV